MEYTQIGLLTEQLDLVKRMIYQDKISIPVWRTRTATYTVPVEYENYSEWTEMSLGTVWKCDYNDSRWFEASVTVPEHFAGKYLVLELNLGGEGLVSINGQPKCSLAFYHAPKTWGPDKPIRHRTRVEIGVCEAGQVLDISIQLNMNYKDHYKGNRFVKYNGNVSTKYTMQQADLCAVDLDTESYYFDALNLMDAITLLDNPANSVISKVHTPLMGREFELMMRSMSRDGVLAAKMTEALQKSMLVIPFHGEESEVRGAMAEASRVLKAEIDKLPRAERGNVYASGLAHIDLVWLWQEKHTVRKIANTMLNTLELANRYPEYIFTMSQPCALSWLEEYYPDIFAKVQEKVKSGNIDLVSNLWVEMDCNLTGGEAMIRQLLYGRKYLLEKFGKCSDVFLMPDSFGYSGALPQIMAKSGVKYFLSAKLSSNEGFHFPHTFFQWQGIDGTRVPTYLMRIAYNGEVNCNHLDQSFHRQECKRTVDASYLTFGYGDGGGGPDMTMLECSRRLTDMPGIPKFKMATLDKFFERATVRQDEFPVWNDELYFDRHRGTYTTQAMVKKNNRKAELAMRKTEMAASLREIHLGTPYPAEQIEKLWKKMLHLQFHDSLPGSSITYVYQDAEKEYNAFFAEQEILYQEILTDLTGATAHAPEEEVLWNFLSWDRVTETDAGVVTVPAMGWAPNRGKATSSLTVTASLLENRFFRMTLDEQGRITSLIHKETGRETLKAPSNVLELFEDPAKARLSAWDIHAEYANKCETLTADSVKVLKVTDTYGVVQVTWHFHNSAVTQNITIYSDIPRIDFKTHADWYENMRLLKAAFYPKVRSSRASYEIQFGAIERPTHRNTEYDAIRFEASGHKWADLSQSDFGISILNDCKYGYDILNDRMRITLLRAPLEPDYNADRGEHDFTYSLYPHAGGWAQAGTVQAAFELNVPADVCEEPASCGTLPPSLVTVDHASVVLDTFKKAEDGNGYILRLYESCGNGGQVTVTLAKELQALFTCNMMEQDDMPADFNGKSFTFETTPYCIHTFRVVL